MADDVRVYNPGGSFINDIGQTVLPAVIKPFDFAALDQAVKSEQDISEKGLETIMENVQQLGKIRDDLTGIDIPGEYHRAEFDAAKKAHGIDDAMFSSAINNIDNPMAMFDADRRVKRFSTDPRVKNAMYDTAIIEDYKARLPTITDPGMRVVAIQALDDAVKSTERNAIKNLNLGQFKEVDLEAAYIDALDKFAPYVPTTEMVFENGFATQKTVTKRDPVMVEKTRQYFKNNPIVMNNMKARGYIGPDGNDQGTWFADIEAGQLVPLEEYSGLKGSPGTAAGGGGAYPDSYNYTPSAGLKATPYGQGIYTDPDTGYDFDLSIISGVETSGRSPADLVHKDPSGNALNIGGYSYNGTTGEAFLDALDVGVMNPGAQLILDQLRSLKLSGAEGINNETKVNKLYAELDAALGGDVLKKKESEYAAKEFGSTAVNYLLDLKDMGDLRLSSGDRTVIMDTAIQFGPDTWKRYLREYGDHVREGGQTSLKQFITNKRIAFWNDPRNQRKDDPDKPGRGDGAYYTAAELQSLKDRAFRVMASADLLDGNASQGTPGEGGKSAVKVDDKGNLYLDPEALGGNVEPGVQEGLDANAVQATKYWHPQQAGGTAQAQAQPNPGIIPSIPPQ